MGFISYKIPKIYYDFCDTYQYQLICNLRNNHKFGVQEQFDRVEKFRIMEIIRIFGTCWVIVRQANKRGKFKEWEGKLMVIQVLVYERNV